MTFPAPGNLPYLGIKLASLVSSTLAGRFFINEPSGKPHYTLHRRQIGMMDKIMEMSRPILQRRKKGPL